MTELMQSIYDYISEHCYREYLPREHYWHYTRLLAKQETDLLEICSDQQRTLLEKYQDTKALMHDQELEAMFQAAWAAAWELA